MHTKQFSFIFPVPLEFFSGCKVITQFTVNVIYTLNYFGKVELQAYTIKPAMAKWIVKWDELEEQMQAAAEHNSKQYRRPGQGGGFKKEYNPMYSAEANDVYEEWKHDQRERERETSNY